MKVPIKTGKIPSNISSVTADIDFYYSKCLEIVLLSISTSRERRDVPTNLKNEQLWKDYLAHEDLCETFANINLALNVSIRLPRCIGYRCPDLTSGG